MYKQRPIFLIGFMGAGKTYSGKLLAEKMNVPFFDLDEYIQEKEGASIPEIFEEKGADHFRITERKCLRDFGVIGKAIIATGGGTPCFFDNLEWMNENGLTIYLKIEPELLAKRLQEEKTQRPLLADIKSEDLNKYITDKLEERKDFYEQASVVFEPESDGDIVEELFKYYLQITGH